MRVQLTQRRRGSSQTCPASTAQAHRTARCSVGRTRMQGAETTSLEMRLRDLDQLVAGLRQNLDRCIKQNDVQGAFNQVEALTKCNTARNALAS
jgi:hypothetical protein